MKQLLTYIEPSVNTHPQIPFCRVAFQPLFFQFIVVAGIPQSQVQNVAFGLVKFHAKFHAC